ncbi:MAG: lipoprotein-releasing ABC transporter permease subunit [Halioglobus sp.]
MTPGERLRIALRYTFPSGRAHLSTFLSSLSMLGLVLAISLLVIVLSVMNGFDKEMRERILSLVPHITVHSDMRGGDWPAQLAQLRSQPGVLEATPFVEFDALVMRGKDIETARGVGIELAGADAPSALLRYLGEDALRAFREQPDGLVLGRGVAERLGVTAGERLTLVVPQGRGPLSARAARFQAVQLVAVLDTGTELDQALALLRMPLASRLAGRDGEVSGFRIVTVDIFDVQRMAWQLTDALPAGYYATHWMMTHGNLYAAIQLSRNLVAILLLSIIAVAAFNVVSSLVLVVLDKQGNIAILRTLGASGRDIAGIFLLQGALIGLVGVVLGGLLGAAGSLAVPGFVAWLEALLDIRFLSTDVYPVSFVPVDLLFRDVLMVGTTALLMCLVAAIYPARRAVRLAPARVLSEDR